MTEEKKERGPSEEDWGNYQADLDQKWAHDQYIGRSNEQMQIYFRNSPIESASDLYFMPEIPFRYYMLGYKAYVAARSFKDSHDASDAASCFLSVVLNRLEEQPRYIVPIMPELLATIEHVGNNQAAFDAKEDIYGKFSDKLEQIRQLYAEAKDRYRNYR